MDIDSKWQGAVTAVVEGLIEKPHRGICPDGWHIPTNDEWNALFSGIDYAAQQAVGNLGWKNATNASGFSALPVGGNEGSFRGVGSYAFFWSATEGNSDYADLWFLDASAAFLGIYYEGNGFAVRCFKDN